MGRRVAEAHNRLGWHWWPGPNAIATRRYGALRPCVQRAACLFGCADGAKSSVDLTHWPAAIALGVHLVTGARAYRVVLGPDGMAGGVEWVGRDGGEHLTRAGHAPAAADVRRTRELLRSRGQAAHAPPVRRGHGPVRGRP
jgi:choline dehydrogenase-like flavoprotein